MSLVFQVNSEVKLHITSEGKILGIEIPKEILNARNINVATIILNPKCKCSKGLEDCSFELKSPMIRYALHGQYKGLMFELDHVTLNNKDATSLESMSSTIYSKSSCPTYIPYSEMYKNQPPSCTRCTLLLDCFNVQDASLEDYYGIGYGGQYD